MNINTWDLYAKYNGKTKELAKYIFCVVNNIFPDGFAIKASEYKINLLEEYILKALECMSLTEFLEQKIRVFLKLNRNNHTSAENINRWYCQSDSYSFDLFLPEPGVEKIHADAFKPEDYSWEITIDIKSTPYSVGGRQKYE